jgi:hypothetical protein
LTEMGMEYDTVSHCLQTMSVHLLGGIVIFSSTQASDSYLATYSFSESEPLVSSSLQSSVQLAAYCLEVGIGLGSCEAMAAGGAGGAGEGATGGREVKCVPFPQKNSSAEKLVKQGHHLLFRSLCSPLQRQGQGQEEEEEEGAVPIPSSSSPSIPPLALALPNGTGAEDKGQQEKEQEQERGIVSVEEYVESPISSSLLLHSDGSLSIKLKCVDTGRTLYQVNVVSG